MTARFTAIRIGRRTQVRRVVISDDQGRQTSEARLAMCVSDVAD